MSEKRRPPDQHKKRRDRVKHIQSYECPRCGAPIDWDPPEPADCDKCGNRTRRPNAAD